MTLFYFLNLFKWVVIPALSIPCVGFLMLQIPTWNLLQSILNYIKVLADCHIFCIIYAQSWHMWTPDNNFWGLMIPAIHGNSLYRIFDAANLNIECTQKRIK